MTAQTSPVAAQPIDDLPRQVADKLLNREQLQSVYGISYSDVHRRRLERDGKFPLRVRISGNRVAYLESEVQAWIRERAAERTGGAA